MEAVPRSTVLPEVTAPGIATVDKLVRVVRVARVVHADVRMTIEVASVESADRRGTAFSGGRIVSFRRARRFTHRSGIRSAVGARGEGFQAF